MAKKGKEAASTEAPAEAASTGQGRAVVLPNGQRRIDFMRDRYYNDGIKRGDIRKEVNALYPGEGEVEGHIPYQIVFAATKTGECGKPETDPRKVEKKPADAAPAADVAKA